MTLPLNIFSRTNTNARTTISRSQEHRNPPQGSRTSCLPLNFFPDLEELWMCKYMFFKYRRRKVHEAVCIGTDTGSLSLYVKTVAASESSSPMGRFQLLAKLLTLPWVFLTVDKQILGLCIHHTNLLSLSWSWERILWSTSSLVVTLQSASRVGRLWSSQWSWFLYPSVMKSKNHGSVDPKFLLSRLIFNVGVRECSKSSAQHHSWSHIAPLLPSIRQYTQTLANKNEERNFCI